MFAFTRFHGIADLAFCRNTGNDNGCLNGDSNKNTTSGNGNGNGYVNWFPLFRYWVPSS